MSINDLVVAYVGLVGLVVGSAINAVVWRLYVGRAWTKGRSMCPECKHVLAARDLIPVVSWLWLRGRCRYCRTRIHWQYPVVEIITGGLFTVSALALGFDGPLGIVRLALWLVVLTLLVILAVYDARWMILPNKVMLPALVVAAAYVAFTTVVSGSFAVASGALIAALLAGGGFYGLVAVSRGRAMGGGDVKLAALMGLMLGLQATAVAMLIAYNTAALYGLAVGVRKRKLKGTYVPFGPFLILGLIAAFLYGRQAVAWYLRVNGLA